MIDEPLTVMAVFRIRPGEEDRFQSAARAAVAATRAESGCIAYELYRNVDDATVFMFHERWRNKVDLDHHLKRPHMTAFLGEAEAVTAGEIEVTLWRTVT